MFFLFYFQLHFCVVKFNKMVKIKKSHPYLFRHGLIICLMVMGLLIVLFNYHIPINSFTGRHANIYGGQVYGFKNNEENVMRFIVHLFS